MGDGKGILQANEVNAPTIPVSDVLRETWRLLKDDRGTHRYLDTELIPLVNDGFKELLRLRPGLRKPAIGPVRAAPTLSQTTDLIPLPEDYLLPLANFAAMRALEAGDEPADAPVVERHRAAFQRSVLGG